MEVHAIDTLSGREETLEIDADATVSAMMRQCGEAFGFGEDVELSVDGQRVACEGAERVSNVAAFSGGCRVGVVRGVESFVTKLRSGVVDMDNLPVWARQRRECVLAMLACALARRCVGTPATGVRAGDAGMHPRQKMNPGAIPSHWVHPSLYGDKEVILQYMRCDPKAFVLASAALRSDADVVIAALEQYASLWRHVENKGLQEQRRVALLAVPHCANSAAWLNDKAFVLEALENSAGWGDVSKALQEDKDVAMKALDCGKLDSSSQLSATLREDKEIMKALVSEKLCYFPRLSATMKEDKRAVMRTLDGGMLDSFSQLSATMKEDKEVVMRALDRGMLDSFSQLSATLRDDKEVVMKALEYVPLDQFHQLGATLQGDKELVMEALRQQVVVNLSATLRADKEVAMEAVRQRVVKFGDLSAMLRADKEVVLEALRQRLVKFNDLSQALRADKEVLRRAISSHNSVDYYRQLREDRVAIVEALTCWDLDWAGFRQMCPRFQEDKQIVMLALSVGAVRFSHLSEALRGDKEFVMNALTLDEMDDYHRVSEALRGDKDVVMTALNRAKLRDFHQLGATLQEDKEVIMTALRCGKLYSFSQLCTTLREDKEVVMEALRCGLLDVFHQLCATLQEDTDIVMKALQKDIVKFSDLSEALRFDKSFVVQAVDVAPPTYLCLTGALCHDTDLALAAIARSPPLFVSMDTVLRDNLDVALAAIRADPRNFIYAGDSVRADRQATLAAFYHRGCVLLPFASAELQADREVVLAAIGANKKNAVYANPALQDLVEAPRITHTRPPHLMRPPQWALHVPLYAVRTMPESASDRWGGQTRL